MAGRPRKPKGQKLIQGTFRKDRNPEKEPTFDKPDQDIRPPTGLNRWGKKFWREHINELIDSGVLTVADMPIFYQLCKSWGDYQEADYDIHHGPDKKKRSTAEYRKGRGYQRKSMPEMLERREAWEQFYKLSMQLGMTPSSRNKIDLQGIEKGKEVDPMEKLLAEGDS
ncbi:MAG: phage terminase small subunit P27 family [Spirochaetia bacterium]|nr:phage terminase small subunit P27 family [Spirochaetia bacterium]MCF7945456.1 phage terminase small subunit P27 family [Spirochaetia bacterium]